MINNALKYLNTKVRKNVLSQEDFRKIKMESESAKQLMTNKGFSFLIDFLNDNRTYILDLIAKNDLKDVSETISREGVKRTFKSTKQEQYFENAGIYKFIGKLNNYIISVANRKDEIDKQIERGFYVLEQEKDDK